MDYFTNITHVISKVNQNHSTPIEETTNPDIPEEEKPALLAFIETAAQSDALLASSEEAIASFLKSGAENQSIANLLIEYAHNPLGWPGLHYAIEQNRPDVAKAFIFAFPEQIGMTIHSNNFEHGVYALELAIKKGLNDIIELLLQNGADPNLAVSDTHETTRSIFDPLKYTEQDFGTGRYTSYTPLYWAIVDRQEAAVQLLLDHGAKLDRTYYGVIRDWKWSGTQYVTKDTNFESSALRLSLEANNEAITKTLLQHQLKQVGSERAIDASLIEFVTKYEMNDKKWPAIQYAVFCDEQEAFEQLLQLGFQCKEKGGCPETAFQLAMKRDNPRYCQLLLQYGFDKALAFEQASRAGNVEWMKQLAHAGRYTLTWPIQVATSLHDLDLVIFLYEAGFRDIYALLTAFSTNQLPIAKYIVEAELKNFTKPLQPSVAKNILHIICIDAIRQGKYEFFELCYPYGVLSSADAIIESMNAANVPFLEYLLKDNVPTSACYQRAVELNRLDLLKVLDQHHAMPATIRQECIKRAVQANSQDILDYLLNKA